MERTLGSDTTAAAGTTAVATTLQTTAAQTTTGSSGTTTTGTVAQYRQCGGIEYNGDTGVSKPLFLLDFGCIVGVDVG